MSDATSPSRSDSPEPDWSLLPEDPLGFFALEEGFDRTALKRAYNALVRRYKPEHHPAEFQQIRAAYEQLDQMLSYPAQFASLFHHRPPAVQQSEESESTRTPRVQEKSLREKLIEQLATRSPAELYAELKQGELTSPEAYTSLAILADVVERDQPLRFVEWLLAGLKKFPQAEGLRWMLFEYLRSPLPEGLSLKLLPACAGLLSQGDFYAFTEPVWEELLKAGQTAVVQKLLPKCEQKLQGIALDCQAVFRLRMARIALWQSDPQWGLEALAFAEAHFHELPDYFTQELDLLAFVREYIQRRSEFVADDPLRQAIDGAMATYFTREEQQADAQVVATNVQIATNPTATAAAFPRRDDGAWDHGVRLWMYTSYDVSQRVGIELTQEFDQELWYGRVVALMQQLNKRFGNSMKGVWWFFIVAGHFMNLAWPVAIAIIVPPAMSNLTLLRGLSKNGLIMTEFAIFCFCLFIAYRYAKWLRSSIWPAKVLRYAKRAYSGWWRDEFFAYLQRSRTPVEFLHQCTAHAASQLRSTNFSWMADGVANDRGLECYAMAQQFLR